jgi:hypothetical protein
MGMFIRQKAKRTAHTKNIKPSATKKRIEERTQLIIFKELKKNNNRPISTPKLRYK